METLKLSTKEIAESIEYKGGLMPGQLMRKRVCTNIAETSSAYFPPWEFKGWPPRHNTGFSDEACMIRFILTMYLN